MSPALSKSLAPTSAAGPSASGNALHRAGSWFLQSGIQEINGGVARYHFTDRNQNARISTEITGYAVSTLVYLHKATGEAQYWDAAERAARYLCREAWDAQSSTFPFEPIHETDPAYSYFFDLGIIVRGLLTVWRAGGDTEYLERAKEAGLSMAFDFMAEEAVHPIITLPDKQPLPYERRWSREPGCYQLKSALGWRNLAEAAGQPALNQPYERMLEYSLATHDDFLPGEPIREKVMDRLHAYCYFLEALLPVADRAACREALAAGIERVAFHLRDIAPVFARSDVYAQLLRVRLLADTMGAVPLDRAAAAEEAAAIPRFQREDGGYWFGRKNGEFLPFSNPVSTGFCLQALAIWEGDRNLPLLSLI